MPTLRREAYNGTIDVAPNSRLPSTQNKSVTEGIIVADVPQGDRIDVEIWTGGQRIEGKVFVPQGVRLSDSLNDEARRFLSMTEVKIRSLDANGLLWNGSYLAVNKATINVVRLTGDHDLDEPSFAVAGMQ